MNLSTEDSSLLPYKEVNGQKDIRWNTKQVNSEVLQGIIQGESIPEIASRLEKVTGMNRASAIRNARTSMTSAQNKGRIDSYRRAQQDGVILKKKWLAANQPGRTRDWHAELNNVEADVEKSFFNSFGKIMYPGDPYAKPANVYNCRCTLVSVVKGFKKVGENTAKAVDNTAESGIIKTSENIYDSSVKNVIPESEQLLSELGEFKKKIIADDRMDDDYYATLKDKFSHGSDFAKKAFNKFVVDDSVIDADHAGVATYNPITKKIAMHYGADFSNNRGAGATWFHEHGHMIDDVAGKLSQDKRFYELLRKDKVAYCVKYQVQTGIKGSENIYRAIGDDLSDVRSQSGVADIFNGLTNGKIQGCGYHDSGYWTSESVPQEAFAHMFEAQFDGIRYAEMKKYFPNALDYFEKMLKEAVK